MIQDIAPHKFDNSFHCGPAKREDIALCFWQNSVLLKDGELPRFADLPEELARRTAQEAERLFSIDETAFYLLDAQQLHTEGAGRVFLAVHAGFPQYGTLVFGVWRHYGLPFMAMGAEPAILRALRDKNRA